MSLDGIAAVIHNTWCGNRCGTPRLLDRDMAEAVAAYLRSDDAIDPAGVAVFRLQRSDNYAGSIQLARAAIEAALTIEKGIAP